MNMQQSVIPAPRLTVAGIVLCKAEPFPLIPLHWPEAAAKEGAGNLTVAGGGVLPFETPLEAMERELFEEYHFDQVKIHSLSHPRWVAANGKEYVWHLVECIGRPRLVPQEGEVAAAGWYCCPKMLLQGMQQLSKSKRWMFWEAFVIGCENHPELFGNYVAYVKKFRRAQATKMRELSPLQ